MPLQVYNDQNIDLLAGVFQRRREPNFAQSNALGILAMLPGVRLAWGMGGRDTDAVADDSHLGRVGALYGPTFGTQGLAAYADFDGSNDYIRRPDEDGLRLTGALSLGAWVYFDAAGEAGILDKWRTASDNRGYRLYRTAAGLIEFAISTDGAAETVVQSAAVTDAAWYFVGASFEASTALRIYIGRTAVANVAAIPASVFASTADFEAGRTNGGSYLNGRIALAFVTATTLPAAQFGVIYEQTRALFGV